MPDIRDITWEVIRNHYYYVLKELTNLYGEPVISYYGFEKPYSEENWYDGIQRGACRYLSLWEVDNGKILLCFEGKLGAPVPCIIYSDNINCKKDNIDINIPKGLTN